MWLPSWYRWVYSLAQVSPLLGAGKVFPWGPAPQNGPLRIPVAQVPPHFPHLRQLYHTPAPLLPLRHQLRNRRGPGRGGGVRLSANQRAGGKAAVPAGDDGVCLTTLRDRNGTVKGGVRRQAPSRPGVAAESRTKPPRPGSRHSKNAPEISTVPVDNFLWKNLEIFG